jgi:hypothetical protein
VTACIQNFLAAQTPAEQKLTLQRWCTLPNALLAWRARERLSADEMKC